MSSPIASQLDMLAELQSQRDVLAMDKQALIDSILTPEIKAKIADIDIEFVDRFAAIDGNSSALESEIKERVLAYGSSIKGLRLHAVWVKGRVSWDTKQLDGFAKAHPEILCLRKEGEPSVSIRRVNGGER